MSAESIFLSICCAEGGSSTSRRTSVLHFKNLRKYSWKRRQYFSESELAVGMKRTFGDALLERRMISRSMSSVPFGLISPPPIATIAFLICSVLASGSNRRDVGNQRPGGCVRGYRFTVAARGAA